MAIGESVEKAYQISVCPLAKLQKNKIYFKGSNFAISQKFAKKNSRRVTNYRDESTLKRDPTIIKLQKSRETEKISRPIDGAAFSKLERMFIASTNLLGKRQKWTQNAIDCPHFAAWF